jgi:hypothetical protein
MEIDRAPTGFMMIKRQVFEIMQRKDAGAKIYHDEKYER